MIHGRGITGTPGPPGRCVGQRQGLVQQGLALLAVLVGKGLVLDTADKKTLPILIAQLRSADFLKFDMGKVYMMVAIAILP